MDKYDRVDRIGGAAVAYIATVGLLVLAGCARVAVIPAMMGLPIKGPGGSIEAIIGLSMLGALLPVVFVAILIWGIRRALGR